MIPLIPLSWVLIREGWHRHGVALQRCCEQVILPFARAQARTTEAKKDMLQTACKSRQCVFSELLQSAWFKAESCSACHRHVASYKQFEFSSLNTVLSVEKALVQMFPLGRRRRTDTSIDKKVCRCHAWDLQLFAKHPTGSFCSLGCFITVSGFAVVSTWKVAAEKRGTVSGMTLPSFR